MTDDVEYLILDHLKAIRSGMETLKGHMRDVKARLLAMETHQAASHIDSARQSARLDDLDSRLNRVETRLNLAE
jgi:hypothetical protein